MKYQKGWDAGGARVAAALHALSSERLATLKALCAGLMRLKVELQALAEGVDAAVHCAQCGGACCRTGRFHFTSADLLVYLTTGEPLFQPLWESAFCPYLNGDRCLMAAAYRPFNCITFNCEVIEDRLPKEGVARFYALERELRALYAEIDALFPGRSLYGALLRPEDP